MFQWVLQGNGYGLGVLIAARAFLEGGMQEIGVGDLNEALALRGAGITAPIQVCYQPDLQSAAAIARAPDLQVRPSLTDDSQITMIRGSCSGEVLGKYRRGCWGCHVVQLASERASQGGHREVRPCRTVVSGLHWP